MADRRLHLLVEGQTEYVLAGEVLEPYLQAAGFLVSRSIVKTSQPAAGPAHKGGIVRWAQLRQEIRNLLKDTSLDVLTTVVDYYGLPGESPGMANRPPGDPYRRVEHVEAAIAAEIGDNRFVPNLTLHEAETWVFAAADHLGDLYGDPDLVRRLKADIHMAGGAELVNDSLATAPSKRLERYRPDYKKRVDGPYAIELMGLDALRDVCPHLDRWLNALLGMCRA